MGDRQPPRVAQRVGRTLPSKSNPVRSKCCSIGDVVRAISLLEIEPGDFVTRSRIYAALGARVAPSAPIAPPDSEPSLTAHAPAETDPTTQPQRPAAQKNKADEEFGVPQTTTPVMGGLELSRYTPQRMGDIPAWDVPPLEHAVLEPPEVPKIPDQRERLFPDPGPPPLVRRRPLLDPRHARNTLRELCSVHEITLQVDTDRLIHAASLGLPPPPRLPRRSVWRPARTIFIAADVTDRMAVFLADARDVARQLRRATNSAIREAPWTLLTELAASGSERRNCGDPRIWREGVKVLLLSDLGFGTWARDFEWRLPSQPQLGQLASWARRFDTSLAALLPVTASRWRGSIPGALAGLCWSKLTTPGLARRAVRQAAHKARARMAPATIPDAAGGLRLARACLFCSRVTPSRLRALREIMLPHSTPEWEAEAWHSRYMIRSSSGFAFVDHASLDTERPKVIEWTLLVEVLRRFSRGTLQTWTDIDRPVAGQQTKLPADGGEIVPADWNRARKALQMALRDESVLALLTSHELSMWTEELTALRDGQGCVIAEQAREIAAGLPLDHVLDNFEEQLLWDGYLDHLSGGLNRVGSTLARVSAALTDHLHVDEYAQAAQWVRTRLHKLPLPMRVLPEAAVLAALVDPQVLLPEPVPSDFRKQPAAGIRLNPLWRRDVYVIRRPGEWNVTLDPFSSLDLQGPMPYRLRVPGSDQIHLAISGPDAETESVTLGDGEVLTFRADALKVTTPHGEAFALGGPAQDQASDFFFWIGHALRARTQADWTAVRRWANRAASAAPSQRMAFFGAAILEGTASSICEEGVDAALRNVEEAVNSLTTIGTGSSLKSSLRLLRATRIRVALLTVDSRLRESVQVASEAISAVLRENLAVEANLVRIWAKLVRIHLRAFEGYAARSAAIKMLHGIRRLKSRVGRSRLARLACAEGLSAMIGYCIDTARPKMLAVIQKALGTLPLSADSETRLLVGSGLAEHAAWYRESEEAIRRYQYALQLAEAGGRADLMVAMSPGYCRTLYNNAQVDKARQIAFDIVNTTMARRSLGLNARVLGEIAYQLRFYRDGRELEWAEAAARTVPPEDRQWHARLSSISSWWLQIASQVSGKEVAQLLEEFRIEANQGGVPAVELMMLHDLLNCQPVDVAPLTDPKKSFERPDQWEQRAFDLARRSGNTLNAENGFSSVAQHDSPKDILGRTTGRPPAPALYGFGIAIVENLQVHGSVLLGHDKIAEHYLLAKRPDAALAETDTALRYATALRRAEGRVCTEEGYVRATRADALREMGHFHEASNEARATLKFAEGLAHPNITKEALLVLSRVEADQGRWGEALDWLGRISEIALQGSFMLPGGAFDLGIDLIDGRALGRLEAKLAASNPGPGALSHNEGKGRTQRAREIGRKLREKADREKKWKASVPRAGAWLCVALAKGHTDRYPEDVPFNDYWFYGEKLENAGANEESLWFYRGALLRSKVERGISPGVVRKIEDAIRRITVGLPQKDEPTPGDPDFKE